MSWLGIPLDTLALLSSIGIEYPESLIWKSNSNDGRAYHVRDLADDHLINLHVWAKRTSGQNERQAYDNESNKDYAYDSARTHIDRLDAWIDIFEAELRRRASEASEDFE
jgi:hypothetical protein